ncbi:MAG TPA: hypothetical protein VIL72_01825 [Beijerinckiaceae bacterium]
MTTSSDDLYASAILRITDAIANRRTEPDYYAVEDGAFVLDHDAALAQAAAEAIDLKRLLDALVKARQALQAMEDGSRDARAA